jgi:uncharacterized protein YdhG (YjbR/CyaY superfamily)
MKTTKAPKNIDEYISGYPVSVQQKLEAIRSAIKKAVPEAEEKISYQMPAFTLNGILVYFAAHTNHIGFYPTSTGVEAFKDELTNYKCTRGTIQFPFEEQLPLDLITRIVIYRSNENSLRAEMKTGKKKK